MLQVGKEKEEMARTEEKGEGDEKCEGQHRQLKTECDDWMDFHEINQTYRIQAPGSDPRIQHEPSQR